MTALRTRSQWGARPARRRNTGNMSAPSTGHYNGPDVTVRGQLRFDHKYCDALVRGIQNFHMDGRGWNDIAYNFVICPHGVIYEGRGLNTWNGANGTNSGNKTSHAVMCLAGENNPFDMVERAAFRWAVKYISERTSAPYKAIGHRDHKATACPGNTRYDWIHGGMKLSGGGAPPQPPTTKKGLFMHLSEKQEKDIHENTTSAAVRAAFLQDAIEGDNPSLGNVFERQLASLKRIEMLLKGDFVAQVVAGVIEGVRDTDVDVAEEAIVAAVEEGVRNVLSEGVDPE